MVIIEQSRTLENAAKLDVVEMEEVMVDSTVGERGISMFDKEMHNDGGKKDYKVFGVVSGECVKESSTRKRNVKMVDREGRVNSWDLHSHLVKWAEKVEGGSTRLRQGEIGC